MYFLLKSDVPKFSYILHKNPNSLPYESEISCGKVIGQFLNEYVYQIHIEKDNMKFLKTVKQLNLDVYLNTEYSSVCPYNLKSMYEALRSVMRGTTNTSQEIMTTDEFLAKGNHLCIVGPYVEKLEFLTEMFNSFDLSINTIHDTSKFTTSHMLEIQNNNPISLTEFLQKIYIISIFVSMNRKSIFNIDENTIEKLVFLSKDWLFNSDKFNMIINRFCRNNQKFKDKFLDIIKDPETSDDDQIETINQKISLHQRRHNILIEKLNQITCSNMIDLCSSEGKLLEQVNKNYPSIKITGFEKDFYKIKKFSDIENVKMIESNILFPRITEAHVLPDLLTCVEAIEHFEKVDRIKILEMIRDVITPNYLYLTTPNIEFNKFYNLTDGKLRRRDHMIEYTLEQFKSEVIDYLSTKYVVEFIDIIEPTEEFEYLQPSFCIFCTHKSISYNDNLIEISKPYPLKDGETDPRIFSIKVSKLDWTPEKIEAWYNDTSDYRKPKSNPYARKVDYKKLNSILSMQGDIFLPNCGYTVNSKELNAGYTSFNFIKNSNNIFYIAPTISPVESLYKNDLNSHLDTYGAYDKYIEHPLSAFNYYSERGITDVICQTKYMGSRAQILWFDNTEIAKKFGFNENVIVNSRGGYQFFDQEDKEKYHSYIDNDIRSNYENVRKFIKNDFDFIILDAEILPWSYKAKNLINEQFRAPIESYYLSHIYSSPEIDSNYILNALNTLNTFSKESDVKIHPFHVLLCGDSNKMNDCKHGYHMNHLDMMDIIDALSNNSKILNACEYNVIDLRSVYEKRNSIKDWLNRCGKSPDETIDVECNDDIIEGFVYKPINFENYLHSGYYVQPALKVRGYNYLNLTYGINLYEDEKYFNQIKSRRVSKKRIQAVQEFEMSKYILNAFMHNKNDVRLKYIAGFFGMENFISVDRTL